jgi:hypothetical protein
VIYAIGFLVFHSKAIMKLLDFQILLAITKEGLRERLSSTP